MEKLIVEIYFWKLILGEVSTSPPAVIYPNDEINVDEYYALIMVDPDADLADNGSWNYDSPNPTPGNAMFHEFSIPDPEFSQ